MPRIYDFIIIGAGMTGSFLARDLSRYDADVAVIEAENDVGNKTTGANSALIHSGYDPKPGTLKAKLNVLGNAMYDEVCRDLHVTFRRIGSLTVAENAEGVEKLKELQRQGEINGVRTEMVHGEKLHLMEPNLSKDFIAGLYAPSCAIIDPFTLAVNLMENAVDNGVRLFLNEKVVKITKTDDHYEVKTTKNTHYSRFILNAAGVNCDEINALVGKPAYQIKARKGSYFVFDHFDEGFLRHVIFPLPDEKGKGVVVTTSYSHNYLAGPDSNYSDDKDDMSTDKEMMAYIKERVKKTVPKMPLDKIIRQFSGLRATPSTGDFILGPIEGHTRFINVAGIESPGLASGPAISRYVIDNFIRPQFPMKENRGFNPRIRPAVDFKTMSEDEINGLIRKQPSYGHMVCRCEHVTEGHITDALSRSCPPHSYKAMKKRVRTGFGRCQGGFCQPFVLKIMADHYKVRITDINYDGENTSILKYPIGEDDDKL